jgi:hypothetical protein
MFPKARKAKVDTEALGATMLKRKNALITELGPREAEDESEEGADEKPACAAKR